MVEVQQITNNKPKCSPAHLNAGAFKPEKVKTTRTDNFTHIQTISYKCSICGAEHFVNQVDSFDTNECVADKR